MSNKLVKEIITTETEKYGEDGVIKEKTRETREKVYDNSYTEKQISEAETEVEPELEVAVEEVVPEPKKQEVPELNQELIDAAAKSIDAAVAAKEKPAMQPQNNYNVINRTTPTPMAMPPSSSIASAMQQAPGMATVKNQTDLKFP